MASSRSTPSTPFPRQSSGWARTVLGSAGLAVGALLACLGFAAEVSGELPFRMPAGWYRDRALWYFFALSATAAGAYLLKSRGSRRGGWSASRPGVRFRRVLLYTRPGCHLCEEAADILAEYGEYLPEIEEVDIEGDRGLLQRFGRCVPVVEVDGKVRFRGRVPETLLRRLIEGTPPVAVASSDASAAPVASAPAQSPGPRNESSRG